MTTTKFTLIPMLLALSLLTTACDRAEVTYMVGTLERDRIEIKVESSEPIIAIYARDGEVLKAGSPILDQDPSRAEARLAQLQALRDQARAAVAARFATSVPTGRPARLRPPSDHRMMAPIAPPMKPEAPVTKYAI